MLSADWLKDAPDDLDVSIAQRDFESAMELIEKSNICVVILTVFYCTYCLCNHSKELSVWSG
jgi:hypothetical protein